MALDPSFSFSFHDGVPEILEGVLPSETQTQTSRPSNISGNGGSFNARTTRSTNSSIQPSRNKRAPKMTEIKHAMKGAAKRATQSSSKLFRVFSSKKQMEMSRTESSFSFDSSATQFIPQSSNVGSSSLKVIRLSTNRDKRRNESFDRDRKGSRSQSTLADLTFAYAFDEKKEDEAFEIIHSNVRRSIKIKPSDRKESKLKNDVMKKQKLKFEENLETLLTFYKEVNPSRENMEDHCIRLLTQYDTGNIAYALYRKYKKYPEAWETEFLNMQSKLKQM